MLPHRFPGIFAIVFFAHLTSCDRIKSKGRRVAETVAGKSKQFASQTVDKVFPGFDAYEADTKNNKARFKSYLGVEPSEDVRNVYAYGDFLGADYVVVIAFTADRPTIDSIIALNKMERAAEQDKGLMFAEDLSWWRTEKIQKLPAYRVGTENEHWQYLWYDSTTCEAYYESYSL